MTTAGTILPPNAPTALDRDANYLLSNTDPTNPAVIQYTLRRGGAPRSFNLQAGFSVTVQGSRVAILTLQTAVGVTVDDGWSFLHGATNSVSIIGGVDVTLPTPPWTGVGPVGAYNGDGTLQVGGLTAGLTVNADGSLKSGGTKVLQQLPSGAGISSIRDPTDTNQLPIAWDGGATAPVTGMWRGFAVATAAGAVEIKSTDGVQVTLGTAAGAGASFAFVLFVTSGGAVTLTNCSIGGGGISV